MDAPDTVAGLTGDLFADLPDGPLIVAVSGGSDSMALLHLLAEHGRKALIVASVDHRLRRGSAGDVEFVAKAAADLSLPFHRLEWETHPTQGNLQANARAARLDLLAGLARSKRAVGVALGHTLDDQAETFLMRLARGSGVDGLSAMSAIQNHHGITFYRPLLGARREDLRAYLRKDGHGWREDPSNDDDRFDRVRMRKAFPELEAIGLTAERLAGTAIRMADARSALDTLALSFVDAAVETTPVGDISLDLCSFQALASETRHRVIAAGIRWITGTPYRPRADSLDRVLESFAQADTAMRTLAGCIFWTEADRLIVAREPGAVVNTLGAGRQWDGRWLIGAMPQGCTLRALGQDGLLVVGNWRDSGWSRTRLLSLPSFWRDGALVAQPLLMPQQGCDAVLLRGREEFMDMFISR